MNKVNVEGYDDWYGRFFFKIPKEIGDKERSQGSVHIDKDPNYEYGCFAHGENLPECLKDMDAKIKTLEENGRVITGNIEINHRTSRRIIMKSRKAYEELKAQPSAMTAKFA